MDKNLKLLDPTQIDPPESRLRWVALAALILLAAAFVFLFWELNS